MAQEIRIILDSGAEAKTLQEALGPLKEYAALIEKINKDKGALGGSQKIAEIQKLTAELKKAELEVEALRKKAAAQTEKETQKLKEQSGVLGQLIQKKKQLQGSLVSAKTIEDVRRINGALAQTNLEIVKLKNTGVSSFNTFEKALSSFQFKFNLLGNLVAGLTGALSGLAVEGIKALVDLGKEAGYFGDAIAAGIANTKNLETALQDINKALSNIGAGSSAQLLDAFNLQSETIGFKILQAEQVLRDAYRLQVKGVEDGEAKKKEAIEKASAELQKLLIEKRSIELKIIIETERKKTDTVKKGTNEEIQTRVAQLEELKILALNQQRTQQITFERAKILRTSYDSQIEELNEQFKENEKEASDELAKQKKDDAKKALDEREKSLQKEFDAFVKYWDKVDKEERDRQAKLFLDKINAEQKAAEELVKKRQEVQKDLEEQDQDLTEQFLKSQQATRDKAARDKIEAQKKADKEFLEQQEKMADLLVKVFTDVQEKRIALTQKQLTDQEKAIDIQRSLAERGLQNTLAFEEKRKAELEQREREEQKRLERIKKLEAYFNLFAEYSKDPDKKQMAALLAFKDIAIAEALSAAFAKEGGIVDDIATPFAGGSIQNGVFVGNSHERGGILLEAEGREGIFSAKEMENLGRDRFYAIKDLLKNPINDDDFNRQEQSFMNVVPIRSGGDRILAQAVEKLTEKFDKIPQIHQGIDDLDRIVETRIEAGMKRTILRPKRQI